MNLKFLTVKIRREDLQNNTYIFECPNLIRILHLSQLIIAGIPVCLQRYKVKSLRDPW